VDTSVFLPPTRAEFVMLLRLVLAALAGAAVGWNRYRAGKPAGVGTHAVVALGAALFVAIPAFAGAQHLDALSRAIQGVATGVGFLGAGEIFRDPGTGNRVTGLTSAAALWATAALGIVIASGSFFGALSATVLVLAVLEIAPRIESRLPRRDPSRAG
jgi:putative Mg2+ transporter-C (MgtC) family protein